MSPEDAGLNDRGRLLANVVAQHEDRRRKVLKGQERLCALAEAGMPEPGVYSALWKPPADWGPYEVIPATTTARTRELGLPFELLMFRGGQRLVRRLLRPVHGFDDVARGVPGGAAFASFLPTTPTGENPSQ